MRWKCIKQELPLKDGRFKIKTEREEEIDAFFYLDGMEWIRFYGRQPTHWWNSKTLEPIYDATHWKEI
jgi:hypothetical protein